MVACGCLGGKTAHNASRPADEHNGPDLEGSVNLDTSIHDIPGGLAGIRERMAAMGHDASRTSLHSHPGSPLLLSPANGDSTTRPREGSITRALSPPPEREIERSTSTNIDSSYMMTLIQKNKEFENKNEKVTQVCNVPPCSTNPALSQNCALVMTRISPHRT
jgi:hypothetical protein